MDVFSCVLIFDQALWEGFKSVSPRGLCAIEVQDFGLRNLIKADNQNKYLVPSFLINKMRFLVALKCKNEP